MRKERKYNYIYKTTCSVTDKYYIGMHSTDILEDGYLGSGKRLWFSINYHGKENHTKEIIEFCDTREELKQREAEIVNEQLLTEKLCMNLMTGGQGGIINEAHKKKMRIGASKWMTEKWNETEYREKIIRLSGERMKQHHKNGKIKYDTFTGREHTNDAKEKMSIAKKGKGTGESNSQFGTCWITKDGVNKKIQKIELEYFLNLYWEKGRKMN